MYHMVQVCLIEEKGSGDKKLKVSEKKIELLANEFHISLISSQITAKKFRFIDCGKKRRICHQRFLLSVSS